MTTKKTTLPQGQPMACPLLSPIPFDKESPEIRALVMKAAKTREAACWSQIKDRLLEEKKMTTAQVREFRAMMLGYFQRAAVRIFSTRAEGASGWDTWIKFVHQAAIEDGVSFDQVEA